MLNTNLRKWGARRTEMQSVASRRRHSHISEKKAQGGGRLQTQHLTSIIRPQERWEIGSGDVTKGGGALGTFPLQGRLSKSARVTFTPEARGVLSQPLHINNHGSTLTFGVNQVTLINSSQIKVGVSELNECRNVFFLFSLQLFCDSWEMLGTDYDSSSHKSKMWWGWCLSISYRL